MAGDDMKVRDAHGNNVELLTREVGDAHAPMHGRVGRQIVASGRKLDAGPHGEDWKTLKVAFEHVRIVMGYDSLEVEFTIDGHVFEMHAGDTLSEAYRGGSIGYRLTPEASVERAGVIEWNEANAKPDDPHEPQEVPSADFRIILSR